MTMGGMGQWQTRRGARPYWRVAGTVLTAAVIGLAAGGVCRADGLVISAPDVTATPGSGGSFDVIITNTNSTMGGASYQVASDNVDLTLTGPSGVNFTSVSIATTDTYIYVDPASTNGLTFTNSAFPGTNLEVFDLEFGPLGSREIDPQQSYGLVHVTYTVHPGVTPGSGTLSFVSDTSVSDISGTNLTGVTLQNSSFTVSSVPEPSGPVLLATGVLAAMWRRKRKSGSS